MRRTVCILLSVLALCAVLSMFSIAAGADASHTHDSVTFDTPFTATGGQLTAGNYYLSASVTATEVLVVPEGVTVNLCMNGYTLDMGADHYISVQGTLNIHDCSAEHTGLLTGAYPNTSQGTVTTNAGGFVTLKSGKAESTACYAFVNEGGVLSVEGGQVLGEAMGVRAYAGEVNVSGGSVTSNSAGSAVYAHESTVVRVSGDTFITSESGSAIENYGILYISGGRLEASSDFAVYNYRSTIHVSGGTLKSSNWEAIQLSTEAYLYLSGTPTLKGRSADIKLSGGVAYAHNEENTVAYSGEALKLVSFSPKDRNMMMRGVSVDNKDLFSTKDSGFVLLFQEGDLLLHQHAFAYECAFCCSHSLCDHQRDSVLAPHTDTTPRDGICDVCAELGLAGEGTAEKPYLVTNAAELQNAIRSVANETNYILLQNDISATVTILQNREDKPLVLDLNGKTITSTAVQNTLLLRNTATVQNGTIEGNSIDVLGFLNFDASLTLKALVVNADKASKSSAVYICANEATIENCRFTASTVQEGDISYGLQFGNDTTTVATNLTVEGAPALYVPSNGLRVAFTLDGVEYNTAELIDMADIKAYHTHGDADGDCVCDWGRELLHSGTAALLENNANGTHDLLYSCCGRIAIENIPCTPLQPDNTCLTDETCICGYVLVGETAHHYAYTADGHILTESCENGNCTVHLATATLSAPVGTLVYDGVTAFVATVSYTDNWKGGTLTVTYEKGGISVESIIDAGAYMSCITLGGQTAQLPLAVAKAKATITVDTTPIVKTYGDSWTLPVGTSTFGEVVCDKLIGNLKDAGAYTVTYRVFDTDNYEGDTKTLHVTVNQATHDMSGITFPSQTVKYDTYVHSLAISGILPAGVKVVYTGNAQIQPGVYTVTASFTYDTVNYEAISPMTATLTIKSAEITGSTAGHTGSPQVVVTHAEGFAPDVKVEVQEIAVDSVAAEGLLRDSEAIGAAFAISMVAEGVTVQPDGRINIRLLIPEGLKDKKLRVVHQHNGEAETVYHTAENGYALFSVESLSTFLLVYETKADMAFPWWIVIALGVVLAGGFGFWYFVKNDSKKQKDN